jgi:endonuclease/exonuclease/phosphatase (EEP) superfamily protein YafD
MGLLRYSIQVFYVLVLLAGCAGIPVDNQFVTQQDGEEQSRKQGICEETTFAPGHDLGDAAESGLSVDSISLLDWNIYKSKEDGWEDDLLRYGHGTDLILLQEAFIAPQLVEFFGLHGYSWNFNSAFTYKGAESGVLTASRVSSLNECGIRVKEPIIRLPKTIVVTSYAIKGSAESLVVANVHGINFTLGTGAYSKQFGELQKVLAAHDGPLLIVGDFNDWEEKRQAIVAGLVEALSLTVFPFTVEDKRTRFFGDPVDHILYRGLVPVNINAHPVTSSDHNPITALFRFKDISIN